MITIREHLAKRTKATMAVAFAAWLFFAITGVLGGAYFDPAIGMIGFVAFGGAVLYALFFIKCPRCFAKLGQLTGSLVFSREKDRLNFCPHCGVNLDERM